MTLAALEYIISSTYDSIALGRSNNLLSVAHYCAETVKGEPGIVNVMPSSTGVGRGKIISEA